MRTVGKSGQDIMERIVAQTVLCGLALLNFLSKFDSQLLLRGQLASMLPSQVPLFGQRARELPDFRIIERFL